MSSRLHLVTMEVAPAILDRLEHSACKITLKGDSIRKRLASAKSALAKAQTPSPDESATTLRTNRKMEAFKPSDRPL